MGFGEIKLYLFDMPWEAFLPTLLATLCGVLIAFKLDQYSKDKNKRKDYLELLKLILSEKFFILISLTQIRTWNRIDWEKKELWRSGGAIEDIALESLLKNGLTIKYGGSALMMMAGGAKGLFRNINELSREIYLSKTFKVSKHVQLIGIIHSGFFYFQRLYMAVGVCIAFLEGRIKKKQKEGFLKILMEDLAESAPTYQKTVKNPYPDHSSALELDIVTKTVEGKCIAEITVVSKNIYECFKAVGGVFEGDSESDAVRKAEEYLEENRDKFPNFNKNPFSVIDVI